MKKRREGGLVRGVYIPVQPSDTGGISLHRIV
jgi:hypothetical protein